MTQLILGGDGHWHVECIRKQQFVNQASCTGHEALCPRNKLLTVDVVGKRSKVKWYNGHVIQVESIIISLMIMSQL